MRSIHTQILPHSVVNTEANRTVSIFRWAFGVQAINRSLLPLSPKQNTSSFFTLQITSAVVLEVARPFFQRRHTLRAIKKVNGGGSAARYHAEIAGCRIKPPSRASKRSLQNIIWCGYIYRVSQKPWRSTRNGKAFIPCSRIIAVVWIWGNDSRSFLFFFPISVRNIF